MAYQNGNGSSVPGICTAPMFGKGAEKFRTREEKIQHFLSLELEKFAVIHNARETDLLYLAPCLEGMEISLNGEGSARRRVKVREWASTRLPKVYMAQNFLLKRIKGKLIGWCILSDEGWLSATKVAEAFLEICIARKWLVESLHAPMLCHIRLDDGLNKMGWTAKVQDDFGRNHTLVCLITNGLIIPDLEAEFMSWEATEKLIRVSDCVFRPEFGSEGVAGLIRL